MCVGSLLKKQAGTDTFSPPFPSRRSGRRFLTQRERKRGTTVFDRVGDEAADVCVRVAPPASMVGRRTGAGAPSPPRFVAVVLTEYSTKFNRRMQGVDREKCVSA